MSCPDEEGSAAAAAIRGTTYYMSPPRQTRAAWRAEDEGYAPSPVRGRFSLSTLAPSPDPADTALVDLVGIDTTLRNDESLLLGDDPGSAGTAEGSAGTASGQSAGERDGTKAQN